MTENKTLKVIPPIPINKYKNTVLIFPILCSINEIIYNFNIIETTKCVRFACINNGNINLWISKLYFI